MRMAGEISGDPEFRGLYSQHLLAPRFQQLRALVERARTRGEVRHDLPIDIACAMIAGPLFLYYLALLAEADVELPSDIVDQLARAILKGLTE